MFGLAKQMACRKYLATLVAGVFFLMLFTCFSVVTNGTHTSVTGSTCVSIVGAVDTAILQTGAVLLTLLVSVVFLAKRPSFSRFSIVRPKVLAFGCYILPNGSMCFQAREYCYMSKLFSRGLIHPKLYHVST